MPAATDSGGMDSGGMEEVFTLRAFGFGSTQRLVIQSLCRLSRERSRTYALLGPAEEHEQPAAICLVNMADPEAAERWHETVGDAVELPSVLVGDEPAGYSGPAIYHFSPKQLSSSLLSFLDNIVDQHYGPSSYRDIGDDTVPTRPVAFPEATGDTVARALVIDDSEAVRAQLQTILQRQLVETDVRPDAVSGLAALEENDYDLVFLDVILPDMKGFKACKRIKADTRTQNVHVIMLTGERSTFNKVRGRIAGCDRYLTKPASEKEVVEVLRACIDVLN